MHKILIYITIIIFTILGCNEQNKKNSEGIAQEAEDTTIPLNLRWHVKMIEIGKSVGTEGIGYGAAVSSQWGHYEAIKKKATVTQLIKLINHKSPAVRCYAFQAIASRDSNAVLPILLNLIHDTAKLMVQIGCVGSFKYVGDFVIDALSHPIDSGMHKLSSNEQKKLDSSLIFDKNIILEAKATLLRKIQPIPSYYKRIRELVEKEKNSNAAIALARFRKQVDKEIIASFFKNLETQYEALYAVREFPDDYFYSFVTDVFEYEWNEKYYDYAKWRMCFQALAKFPSNNTLKYFERTIDAEDEFRRNTLGKNLLVAITKYPNKLYEPLKKKIVLSEYEMMEVQNNVKYEG